MKCIRCDSELESGATTEHQQLQVLIDWLCEVTCIKWRRGWLNLPASGCEQYGIVDIETSNITKYQKPPEIQVYEHESDTDENGCKERKYCQLINITEKLSISLIVINDTGNKAGCDDPEDVYTTTAMDVLKHIRTTSYAHNNKPDELNWLNRSNWTIENTLKENKDGEVCGTRSEMRIFAEFCQTISLPIDSRLAATCKIVSCGTEVDVCEETNPDCKE